MFILSYSEVNNHVLSKKSYDDYCDFMDTNGGLLCGLSQVPAYVISYSTSRDKLEH